jgi:hypothetical protein
MSKRTQRDKSVGSDSFDSDSIQAPPKKRPGVSSKAKAQREEGAGSEYVDTDIIKFGQKKGSSVSGKGKGKVVEPSGTARASISNKDKGEVVESSNANVPAKRKNYSEVEKDFLLKKHKELGNWNEIAEAFHGEFKSKADVTIPQLQCVLDKWQKKLGIEAEDQWKFKKPTPSPRRPFF